MRSRKKPTFPLRPSLSRAKTHYSTPIALHAKENVVPFQFSTSHNSSETDLSSCFKASPVQDRKIHFHLHGGPRSRHANLSNMFNRCNGSPVPGVRKTAPAVRPRKQFRRSLSMFENPGDVMNAESEHVSSGLAAIMDIDETPRLSLPTLPSNGEPNSLPRIEAKTLADVLDGQYSHVFEETMVIDCRFEYEYEGGHIDGAVNHCEREALADRLFDPYTDPSSHKKTLLVFHCEYSELRAPRMYVGLHPLSVCYDPLKLTSSAGLNSFGAVTVLSMRTTTPD